MVALVGETPMCFDMSADHTCDDIGCKDVLVKTTRHDILWFTIVLTITASRKKLQMMIIFKNLQKVPKLKTGEKWPKGMLEVFWVGGLIHIF